MVGEDEDYGFCWQHADEKAVRDQEAVRQRAAGLDPRIWRRIGEGDLMFQEPRPLGPARFDHWEPLGRPLGPRAPAAPVQLGAFTDDRQNVHTAVVQKPVNEAVKRLRKWAEAQRVAVDRELWASVTDYLKARNRFWFLAKNGARNKAVVDQIQSNYEHNRGIVMFGVTYPELASFVWARCTQTGGPDGAGPNEDLVQRFFEEIYDARGMCLNGNMTRLMNVFSGLDPEMSPQAMDGGDTTLTQDELQHKMSALANAVASNQKPLDAAEAEAKVLLGQAKIPNTEWDPWLEALRDAAETAETADTAGGKDGTANKAPDKAPDKEGPQAQQGASQSPFADVDTELFQPEVREPLHARAGFRDFLLQDGHAQAPPQERVREPLRARADLARAPPQGFVAYIRSAFQWYTNV